MSVIKCKALINHRKGEPPVLEDVLVDPPGPGQVRVKMAASGICRSDLSMSDYLTPDDQFPLICGHEAAGYVESVGPDVIKELKPGDPVLPGFLPFCGTCGLCTSPISNLCATMTPHAAIGGKVRLADGTPVFQSMALGTFAEYAVIDQHQIIKLPADESVPLKEFALIGCCLTTSVGSVNNYAQVLPGTVCAVWGMGALGLIAVTACKSRGARIVIAIDTNPEKFDKAKRCGATHVLNPLEPGKTMKDQIIVLSPTGVDYTFECVGSEPTINQSIENLSPWGTCVIIGVCKPDAEIKFKPRDFITGKKIMSGLGGGYKSSDAVKDLYPALRDKKFPINEIISQEVPLAAGPEAIKDLRAGKVIRTILTF